MKRKSLVFVLALVLALSLSTLAFAVEQVPVPGGTINIDPIADLQLTQGQLDAGYDVNVTGYVGFNVPSDNQGRLDILKLEVQKDLGVWTAIQTIDNEPPLNSIILTARGNVPGREFGFTTPWTINSVGSYVLKVTADFTGSANDYADATGIEAVTVTLLTTVIVDYPAAPAVAAAILKDAGISHKYGVKGNYIADVAAEMGSWEADENGSWFHGIDKSDESDYYAAVYNYLIELGASLTTLP